MTHHLRVLCLQNYQLGGIGFFFCQNVYFHGP